MILSAEPDERVGYKVFLYQHKNTEQTADVVARFGEGISAKGE